MTQPVVAAIDNMPAEGTTQSAAAERNAEFARLLELHWNRAYRFAYRLAGNAHDAQDLLQEAAEEAFSAFHRFQPGTHFDRWLLRILHNSFLDHVRRDRRRTFFSLEALNAPALVADRASEPEAVAEASLHGPVLRAVESLPPEFRAAVVLVDLEGLTYEEAADILRCPVGTVRSRLHRGRLALREWLRPYLDALKRGDS
jgi:RNA polymerase sigma factor (sigma-70 family)